MIDANAHYAEYWYSRAGCVNSRFGTHASGPSEVLVDGKYQTLKSFIEVVLFKGFYVQGHPECLGTSMGKNNLELPFLSKVLSVDTALSIQAHPDKKLAEVLHRTKPDMYKDDNHKPEMAYALTPFVAMCGFRRADVIVQHLHDCVYLRQLIGEEECQKFEEVVKSGKPTKDALHALFTAYIEADPQHSVQAINAFKEHLQGKKDVSFIEQWVLRLMETVLLPVSLHI